MDVDGLGADRINPTGHVLRCRLADDHATWISFFLHVRGNVDDVRKVHVGQALTGDVRISRVDTTPDFDRTCQLVPEAVEFKQPSQNRSARGISHLGTLEHRRHPVTRGRVNFSSITLDNGLDKPMVFREGELDHQRVVLCFDLGRADDVDAQERDKPLV